MEINKVLRPLVTRFIKVDNYEKMKAILDIGFSGVEMIDKYYMMNMNTEGDKRFQEEIQKLNTSIERMKKEQETEKNELKKKYDLKYLKLEEHANKINDEKMELSFSIQDTLNKQRIEIENSYLEKLQEKTVNLEKAKTELYEYREKTSKEAVTVANKQFNVLQETIHNFNEKLENYRKDKDSEIKTLRDTLNRQYEDSKEVLRVEIEKLSNEKQKIIDELEGENKKYKDKYDKLEVNSVLKGKPYEDAIEYELKELFEKNKNDFTIKRRADKKGKGDFVVTNNYSKYRIMIEAKNMPRVSSSAKDQQPKFYSDLRDKTNNYDGGILLSSGKIEGKKNYDFEILDDGKIVYFIEDYNLNRPENINMILNVLHGLISHSKTNSSFAKEKILNVQVEQYEIALDNLKKAKNVYEGELKLVNKIKDIILGLFNLDVDEYIGGKKTLGTNLKDEINKEIEEFIENECNENKNMKIVHLKKIVYEKYEEYINLYKIDKTNGVSKKMIDSIIKRHIK